MAISSTPARRLPAAGALLLLLSACTASPVAPSYTYAPPVAPGSAASAPVVSPAAPSPTPAPTPSAVPTSTPTFSPGTAAAPRIVDLSADDQLNFNPGFVEAVLGETVTFRIHNTGKATHEFMVGRLADAFADKEGTPEVADIAAGTTGEITFTFDGAGPFGFACHAPGHFEHGMAGYIGLVGPGAPVVGTKADPRIVHIDMSDKLAFLPSDVPVAKGETIRFVLTNSGTVVHEFQVGPADKVAADEVDGTIVVEKDALDAGSTHAVDYTFAGAGPYAFACHEPGHYEAGMKGTITVRG